MIATLEAYLLGISYAGDRNGCKAQPGQVHIRAHRWQKPRIYFALYIMSAAISILRIRYIVWKKPSSSSFVVVTSVEGGSIRCVAYGITCTQHLQDDLAWPACLRGSSTHIAFCKTTLSQRREQPYWEVAVGNESTGSATSTVLSERCMLQRPLLQGSLAAQACAQRYSKLSQDSSPYQKPARE